ncbi:hypothetical protein [Actinoplanes derwentensis]|uniref:Uncharacterized protein n=1 Tax=Actinoplanes derwentensis TaxID=113562 RepID=A0A1H2AGC1_9ACTN|nr:hypothetical protein [Actinoplanes derwentensis]GID88268.1 hypothetical protein Ade03nite_71920 [Actinoplanes derwentensis]SDT45028.1 hypothetical protein SAMN04489716_3849 [Actinoplanes derwentensis]
MTTNQTTIETAPDKIQAVTEEAGQKAIKARSRATAAVRRNPKKSATATTVVLLAAAAAAVLLTRRRSAKATAQNRSRLAQLLNR